MDYDFFRKNYRFDTAKHDEIKAGDTWRGKYHDCLITIFSVSDNGWVYVLYPESPQPELRSEAFIQSDYTLEKRKEEQDDEIEVGDEWQHETHGHVVAIRGVEDNRVQYHHPGYGAVLWLGKAGFLQNYAKKNEGQDEMADEIKVGQKWRGKHNNSVVTITEIRGDVIHFSHPTLKANTCSSKHHFLDFYKLEKAQDDEIKVGQKWRAHDNSLVVTITEVLDDVIHYYQPSIGGKTHSSKHLFLKLYRLDDGKNHLGFHIELNDQYLQIFPSGSMIPRDEPSESTRFYTLTGAIDAAEKLPKPWRWDCTIVEVKQIITTDKNTVWCGLE